MKIWIGIAIAVVVLMAFAGLLPLPGQKDNVTPHSDPAMAGKGPDVQPPVGPAPSPPAQLGGGVPPAPGGDPTARAGRPTGETSEYTATGASPGSTVPNASAPVQGGSTPPPVQPPR